MAMKRIITIVLAVCLLLTAAVLYSGSSANAQEGAQERSRVERIDEQLQGSWGYADGDFQQVWTFNNGTYVADTYSSGVWNDNPSVGIYAIGMESIQTVIQDQEHLAEGQFTYTFDDGRFVLCTVDGEPMERIG